MKNLQTLNKVEISYDDLGNIFHALKTEIKSFKEVWMKKEAANRLKTLIKIKKAMKLKGLNFTIISEY